MKHLKFLLIIANCLIAYFPFAQSNLDFVNNYQEANNKNFNKYASLSKVNLSQMRYDSAEYFAYLALDEAKKINEKQLILNCYLQLADIAVSTSAYEKTDSLLNKAIQFATEDSIKLKIYTDLANTKLRTFDMSNFYFYLMKGEQLYSDNVSAYLIRIHKRMFSTYYRYQGNYLKSYQILNELANEKSISIKEMINIDHELSSTLEILGLYNEAIEVHQKNISKKKEFFEKNPNFKLFNIYSLIALHNKIEEYQKVKQYGYEAIALKDSFSYSTAFGFIYYNLGIAYKGLGQLDSAEYSFKEGIKISIVQNENKELADNYNGMCELYFDRKDFQSAKVYGEKVLDLVTEYQIFNDRNTQSILAEIYAKEGNFKKAHELLTTTYDSPNQESVKNEIIQLFLKDKIADEKLIEKIRNESKLRTRGYLVAILMLFSLFAITVLYYLKKNNTLLGKEVEYQNLITSQKEKLLEKEAFKVRLITNITHELRTPVTIISGYVKELINNPEIANSTKNILRNVLSASGNLLTNFEQLLEISKNNPNTINIHPNKFKLKAFFNYFISFITPLLNTKEISFTLDEVFEDELEIITDAEKLKTILINVITNAIKFTEVGGKIAVIATEAQQTIKIKVKDNGRGIKEKDIPHIFERFFQSQSNDTSEGGMGIGLAVCKEYIELLGGNISVESDLNAGSSFTMVIPKVLKTDLAIESIEFSAVKTEQVTTTITKAPQTTKPSILVVDDNLEMCKYLKTILEEDYHLNFAYSGRTALNFLEKNAPPSLIITDWMMIDLNGLELTEKIKSKTSLSSIPIIMLTARNLTKDQALALQTGIDDYIIKPFDAKTLKHSINNLLDKTKLASEYNIYDEKPKMLKERYVTIRNGTINSINRKEYAWLVQVENIIHAKLSDFDLSTESIANQLSLTTVHLNRKIKKFTGFTTKKYIQEIRYWEARDMLEKGIYDSVKAVCLSVGFKDNKTFSKNFKKRFGRYPKDYLND